MASRLALRLENVIHPRQGTFLRGWMIHDNFRFVQRSAKLLHVWRTPSLLLKINIACTFDSVSWPFLLEILDHLGFPRRWCEWVSAILASASTRVLLNERPGSRICHSKGLRQGDSLSLLLFILVMEVLSALIRLVDAWSLLTPSTHGSFSTVPPFMLMAWLFSLALKSKTSSSPD
jgi:hypothetical protein